MVVFERLYQAEVIDNDDPQKEGRIQIYIPSFMEGWDNVLYPWARPFFNATGGDFGDTAIGMFCIPPTPTPDVKLFRFGELDIPELYTYVWIWFEDDRYKKNAYYITGIQLKDSSPAASFKKITANYITEVKGQYPDVKFRVAPNGYVKWHSSNLKVIESGEYNSKKSYLFQQDDQTLPSADKQISRLLAGTTNKIELKSTTSTQEQSIQLGQLDVTPTNQNFIEIIKSITDQQIILQSDPMLSITMSQLTKIITIIATEVVVNTLVAHDASLLTLEGSVTPNATQPAVLSTQLVTVLNTIQAAFATAANVAGPITSLQTAAAALIPLIPAINSQNIIIN